MSTPSTDAPQQPSLQIDNANLVTPFCDAAIVRSSPDGIVLDFLQLFAPGRAQIVSRAGMSREHAAKLLAILQQHLAANASLPSQHTTGTIGFEVPEASKK